MEEVTPQAEFAAIQSVYEALKPLQEEARARVIGYVSSLFGIAAAPATKVKASAPKPEELDEEDEAEDDESSAETSADGPITFATFAELFDAAQPETAAEKALVAGYWLQVCSKSESFDGQRANKELKHLGHGVLNITAAIEALKKETPALALQLKKSGTSQQARKTYKITHAGIKEVEKMINGS